MDTNPNILTYRGSKSGLDINPDIKIERVKVGDGH